MADITLEIRSFILYLLYGVNFIGIVGKIFAFVIFSRKSFEKSSIGVYGKCLAIFDQFIAFNLILNLVSIATDQSYISSAYA